MIDVIVLFWGWFQNLRKKRDEKFNGFFSNYKTFHLCSNITFLDTPTHPKTIIAQLKTISLLPLPLFFISINVAQ